MEDNPMLFTFLSFFPCFAHLKSSSDETTNHMLADIIPTKSHNPVDSHSHTALFHRVLFSSQAEIPLSLGLPPPAQAANKCGAIDLHTHAHTHALVHARTSKCWQAQTATLTLMSLADMLSHNSPGRETKSARPAVTCQQQRPALL